VLVGDAGLVGGIVGHVVGGHAVETVVGLGVFLQAALNLEAEVVDDFPVESGVGIPVVADILAVIVGNGTKRRGVVAEILLLIGADGTILARDLRDKDIEEAIKKALGK
jgi:hypothetical protein